MAEIIQRITPFLWFGEDACEAAKFYVSIFKDSGIKKVVRYSAAGPGQAGSVMTVQFELEGMEFTALNGVTDIEFNQAVSLVINCESQDEIDYYWEKLTAEGEEQVCGWLKDKYGLSWQVVPKILVEYLSDSNPQRVKNVTEAMLKMVKINIEELKQAYKEE
ncbi:3-demethylubiquinone-9 3-methyltransferase [Methanobacterium lacus]|uniref:3-demethylubiquinone-9 3-methyltransferase n=1 Tax=Methanobacterium lacus (strain AL-21) TaxID=877455 RepID=F0T9E8_METLA|nr:VOC family protein [Methanobacterium lacus]ADZ09899.1 3-demethylubiquinone-9 3-methyltransferase [Methanobacterium lacus]